MEKFDLSFLIKIGMSQELDIQFVRQQFPALKSGYSFMDNAGGSQSLGTVMERIKEFMTLYNVQLGASYEVSSNAGDVLDASIRSMALMINCDPKEVVVGPSTTMLLRILSICLSKGWKKGDEVIVTNSDHEANVSCWNDLEAMGIAVKIWKLNAEGNLDPNDLLLLISRRTRLVAMVHVSNILGTINLIKDMADIVHNAGALICVDGVAFAPHRHLDMKEWDIDFYVFSTYKTYGPHQAILYGKMDLLLEMEGINHYFVTKNEVPYKFQPGNFNFELTYSLKAIPDYFQLLYDHHFNSDLAFSAESYQKIFDLIANHEERLAEKLIDYLLSKSMTIIGVPNGDKNLRVPTISFVHPELSSKSIVEKVDPHGIGIRYGDFYAKAIVRDLDLEKNGGVVRISLLHYNSVDEIDHLITVLDTIL